MATASPSLAAGHPKLPDRAEARLFLESNGWLATSDPAFRAAMLDGCRWRVLSEGDVLAHEGDTDMALFGVAAGCLAATSRFASSDVEIVHIWHAGDWTGEVPLVTNGSRRGTVTARVPTLIAHVPAPIVRTLLTEHPAYWREIAELCEKRAALASLGGLDLLRRDAAQRCVAALLRLAGCRERDAPDGPPFMAVVSQQELAETSNLCRNVVGQLLNDLESEGLIGRGYRRLFVNDPAALRARLA